MQEFVMEESCGGGAVICESSGEYTLPDYMPEVRRVLRLDADATIAGQYENGDKTEVGGDTRYVLLYADAEGQLAAAELDGTFDGVVNIPQGTPMMVYPQVENTSCRLGGPRKVSLRAGISLHPYATRGVTIAPPAVDEVVGTLETLTRPVHISQTAYFHADDLALTESVKCEAGTNVLTTEAKALVREVKCEEGQVRVRGEAWMKALAVNAEGTPCTLQCKIPFEESISCDGVTPDFIGVARSNCRRVSCEATEGGSGSNAVFDVTLILDGIAVKNGIGEVVTDIYATTYEMKPKSETVTGCWYPVMQMANFTVDGSVPRESLGIGDEPLRPVDARAVVTSATCVADGSAAIIEGTLRVSCILACDPADGNYRSESFDLPYKVRISCGEAIPHDTTLTSDVICISCRARADGARLSVDAELGILLIGEGRETVTVIRSAEPDPDAPVIRANDEIIAAYLSDGDTLWSIGKRYHVPLADIVRANSLPDEIMGEPDFAEELDGLTRLMIL